MSKFSLENIPDQPGKIAIVTGANSGLGYQTTLGLVQKKIKVIMACRNSQKAESAKNELLKEVPDAELEIIEIDLSSLKSVRNFADEFQKKYNKLDLLINNAGVMVPPYQKTEDGFELQMAVNYFGHFALCGLLLKNLEQTEGSRVISLSSIAHKNAKINFQDLQSKTNYSKFKAYGQSKLACLMFSKEFQRRLTENGYSHPISVAAHPGVSTTELFRFLPKLLTIIANPFTSFFSHSPKNAAKNTLIAALGSNVKGADYYGPQGFNEMKGEPGEAKIAYQANNFENAKRLWEISEKETGVGYTF